MATLEDRQHNERLIYNYTRRLKILEDRRSKQGDSTDPAVDIEIEELRLSKVLERGPRTAAARRGETAADWMLP